MTQYDNIEHIVCIYIYIHMMFMVCELVATLCTVYEDEDV